MVRARKVSVWRGRYEIESDGRVITTWDSKLWKTGGDFTLDGRLYEVRGNMWGSRFTMTGADGTPLASAERVGRKRWTVEAGGRQYDFQRASWFSNDQQLHTGGVPVGSVRRTSWRGDAAADLPGLPLPVQVFVVGVVVTMWDAQAAAAAG